MRIVMLGPPGAGKGTQAQILEQRYDVWQVSTGDLLRMHRTENTTLGKQASDYMDRGELVPDSLIIAIVESALEGVESFILDGFPRTVAQAEALDHLLERMRVPLDAVVLFHATHDALVQRLTARWVNPRTGRSYNTITMPPVYRESVMKTVYRWSNELTIALKRLKIALSSTASRRLR